MENFQSTRDEKAVNGINLSDLDIILEDLVNVEEYRYFIHGTDLSDGQSGYYPDDFDKENEEYRRNIEEGLSCIFQEGLYARDDTIDITAVELGKNQDNTKKRKQLKDYIENGYVYKRKNTLILLEIPKKCFSDKIDEVLPLFEYDKEGKGVWGITGSGLLEHYRIPKEYIKCAIYKNGKEDRYLCENQFYDKSKVVDKGIIENKIKIEIDKNTSIKDIKRYIELCESYFDATNMYDYLKSQVKYINDIILDRMGEIDDKEYEEINSYLERLYQKSKTPLDLQKEKIEQIDFTELTDLEIRELLEEFYSISSTEIEREDYKQLFDKYSFIKYKECLALLSKKCILNNGDKILLNIKINNIKKYEQMLEYFKKENTVLRVNTGEEITELEKNRIDSFYKLINIIGKEDKNLLSNIRISDIKKQMEWYYNGQTLKSVSDINNECTLLGLDFNTEMKMAKDRANFRNELDEKLESISSDEYDLLKEIFLDKAESIGVDYDNELKAAFSRKYVREQIKMYYSNEKCLSINEINEECERLGMNFNAETQKIQDEINRNADSNNKLFSTNEIGKAVVPEISTKLKEEVKRQEEGKLEYKGDRSIGDN